MIIVTILHHNRVYISNADTTVLIGKQADITAVLRHKQRICLQMNLKLLRLFIKPLWGLEKE